MAIDDSFRSAVDLISNLDDGNLLYLQNNDNSSLAIVIVKLVGAENYKMRATTMKIALKGKNKMDFIDGTYVKQVTSPTLSQQWERCNAIVLGWILGPIKSTILAKDPLPNAKDAFYVFQGRIPYGTSFWWI
ncbi:ribonuclease H-like domain-containing protein, partial [Tanacetum coccineum]